MIKIVLNNEREIEIVTYDHQISVIDNVTHHTCSVNVYDEGLDDLSSLAGISVTDIELYINNNKVVDSHNLNAFVSTIAEQITGEHLATTLTIKFIT